MEIKQCNKCKQIKSISEFYVDRSKKDEFSNICKQCKDIYACSYYINNKDKCLKNIRKQRSKRSHRTWSRSTIYSHKEQEYDIQLTLDELENLAIRTIECPYCDIELDWSLGNKNGRSKYNSPSLDRINNGKILTIDNVQILCIVCNMTKGTRTEEEFASYCLMVSKK